MKKGHYAGRADAIDTEKAWLAAPALLHVIKNYDPQLLIYWDKSINMYCIARNGEMGLHFISVWPLPRANELEVAALLKKRIEEVRPTLPAGVEMTLAYDGTYYMDHAIKEITRNFLGYIEQLRNY